MAYNVYFACDKCGCQWSWVNQTVSLSVAKRLARAYGWEVGKQGWICPACKTARDERRRMSNERTV